METYEWSEHFGTFRANGEWVYEWLPGESGGGRWLPFAKSATVVGELLRLAERVRELEAICTIRERRELWKDAEVAKHGRKVAALEADNRRLRAWVDAATEREASLNAKIDRHGLYGKAAP